MSNPATRPDRPTIPSDRSLTDLYRDATALGDVFHTDRSRGDIGRPYIAAIGAVYDRLSELHEHRAVLDRAQLEHPHLAWTDQAAVFTTGQFEERSR